MRSLIVITILCLTSTPAFACVFDTDCKLPSSGDPTSDDDNVPRAREASDERENLRLRR
jgi:hypothetical protein